MNAKNDSSAESEPMKSAAEPSVETPAEMQPTQTPTAQPSQARTKKAPDPIANADVEKPAAEVPVVAASPATDANAPGEVAPVHAPVQTIYVTAPTPPRPKGNRGIGILMSIVATAVFAVVYIAFAAILTMFVDPTGVVSAVTAFVASPFFFVPVLVFLVAMILWALVANRASWWSWVVGSFVVAAITYFASIGVFLLMQGGFGMTASMATLAFMAFAVNPAIIAAALIARECAIWFGAAIAKRGRKVRERNYDAWQNFEREEAQKRAEFGGAAAV